MIERGDPLFAAIRITRKCNLEECSMFWIRSTWFLQASNFRIKKLCCMCLKNEAVIKMIMKGRSPTMRHVCRTHRVALDWLFDRINSDPKIQIKCIDTKNQLADMLTKGTCTRDEWNHLLCLFNTSHFSSTDCPEVMSTRMQEEWGEERVTAKSRPMMRCKGACSSVIFCIRKPGEDKDMKIKVLWLCKLKSMTERRNPLFAVTQITSTTITDPLKAHTQQATQWNVDKAWSSQEWKSDLLMGDRTEKPVVCPPGGAHAFQSRFSREHKTFILEEEENHDRTVKPVVCPQGGARAQQFVIGDDETGSELSLGSRSRAKKGKRTIFNVCDRRQRQTFCDMRNVHVFNIAIICFHGAEILRQLAFHQKHEKSDNETDVRHIWEIGIRTRWDLWSENNWLGQSFMEVFVFDWWWGNHQSSTHKDLRIFRFCIVSWKDEREPSIKHSLGRKTGVVHKFTGIQKLWQNWRWANGVRVEFVLWIQYVAAQSISLKFTVEIGWDTRESYRKDYLHVDVQRHLIVDKKTMEKNASSMLNSFLYLPKDVNQTMVISRSWLREKVVFYQCR